MAPKITLVSYEHKTFIPPKEHEKKDTITEDVFYPDHAPRTESVTFAETKRRGHAQRTPCAISGVVDGVEYHHFFIEWAMADAVDWEKVKRLALGYSNDWRELDLHTDLPTERGACFNDSLICMILEITKKYGFDWGKFDPAKPETFIDSPANMLVLHEKFHRGKDHGIHCMSFPEWVFQAWPRKAGFTYTPDEEHENTK